MGVQCIQSDTVRLKSVWSPCGVPFESNVWDHETDVYDAYNGVLLI